MDFNRQNIFQATTAKKTVVWDEGLRSICLRYIIIWPLEFY